VTLVHVTPPVVLTMNSSDPMGFGGIAADLRTFVAHRAFGAAIITAADGPGPPFPLPATSVGGQLSALLSELRPDAAKVGAVGTPENAAAISARVRSGEIPKLVLDPVLDSAGGHRRGVIAALMRLIPLADIITPNIDEASALVGWAMSSTTDMAGAAAQLASNGAKYVVITGGRLSGDESIDAIWTNSGVRFLHAPRLTTPNRHGIGTTFSAAIAANLALGAEPFDAVAAAKEYVGRAVTGARDWKIGFHGGPVDQSGGQRTASAA
jgi:hydroxymethylpyrimidine/phosphomethylpyrimidine kinase